MVRTTCIFLLKYRNWLLILVILSLSIVIFQNLYAHGLREEPTFKVRASKTKPDLNESVTIIAEYTAPKELKYVTLVFELESYKSKIFQKSEKIKLISGDRIWRGSLKKGEFIKKEIDVAFPASIVYCITINIMCYYEDKGVTRTLTFYPAGAFKHDYRNLNLRREIGRVKRIIADSSIRWEDKKHEFESGWRTIIASVKFNPDTGSDSENIDFDPDFLYEDEEHREKNDSLNKVLKVEYDNLLKELIASQQGEILIKNQSSLESNSSQVFSETEKIVGFDESESETLPVNGTRPKDDKVREPKPTKSYEEIYRELLEENIKYYRPMVPQMIKELNHSNPDIKILAIEGLGKSLDIRAIAPLIEVMKNDSVPVNRGYSAHSLGAIGEYNNDKSAVPALQSALSDEDIGVALNAALALVKLGEYESAYPILASVYKGENREQWQAEGFADIGTTGPKRKAVLEQQKNAMRYWALEGLVKTGDERVKALLENTQGNIIDIELRHRTDRALEKMEGK